MTPDWDSAEQTFLVCIHNVSADQPYTIIQAPVSSTAQDIITQVRDWSLITGRGGLQNGRGGGHVKFYPYEKGGRKEV